MPALSAAGGPAPRRPEARPVRALAAKAKSPLVERVKLGAHVTTGRIVVAPDIVFVGDGPNREIIVVVARSRQVYRRIKLREPPHDLGLSDDGRHLWATLEDRWVADIDLATLK